MFRPLACKVCGFPEASSDLLGSVTALMRDHKCPRCGQFIIAHDLTLEPFNQSQLSAAIRERSAKSSDPLEIMSHEDINRLLDSAPSQLQQKFDRLLKNLYRQTPDFGAHIELFLKRDFPLAWANDGGEFYRLLKSLEQQGFLNVLSAPTGKGNDPRGNGFFCVLTEKAFFRIESGAIEPKTVFLSSTCFDLLDLRAEIATTIESMGHIVRVSDSEERFEVDGITDSISVCLKNLEQSDCVVVIVDRRYGGFLKGLSFAEDAAKQIGLNGLSATHLEILHARKHGKPVFTYIRDKTLVEIDGLKADPGLKLRWLQIASDSRQAWDLLITELRKLEDDKSNWTVAFRDVVELKKLLSQRLNRLGRKS